MDAKCGLERVEVVVVKVEGGVVKRQYGLGGKGEDEAFSSIEMYISTLQLRLPSLLIDNASTLCEPSHSIANDGQLVDHIPTSHVRICSDLMACSPRSPQSPPYVPASASPTHSMPCNYPQSAQAS